jgi:hypothetical protein
MFGGDSRYEKRLRMARADFQIALDQHAAQESDRQQRVVAARGEHERRQAPVREKYTKLEQGWRARNKDAVED